MVISCEHFSNNSYPSCGFGAVLENSAPGMNVNKNVLNESGIWLGVIPDYERVGSEGVKGEIY